MSLKDALSPSDRPGNGAGTAFEAVLTSGNAPKFGKIGAIGFAGALAIWTLTRNEARLLGDNASVFATGSISLAACIFALRFWRRSSRACERIVVGNGVIRVSRYVHGRLIDQRRVRSSGLAVEFEQDSEGECLAIALREKPRRPMSRRTIEIARALTPKQRAKFLEGFIEGLRRSGANPEIFRTAAPSKILRTPSTCVLQIAGRARGATTRSWAQRSAFRL